MKMKTAKRSKSAIFVYLTKISKTNVVLFFVVVFNLFVFVFCGREITFSAHSYFIVHILRERNEWEDGPLFRWLNAHTHTEKKNNRILTPRVYESVNDGMRWFAEKS